MDGMGADDGTAQVSAWLDAFADARPLRPRPRVRMRGPNGGWLVVSADPPNVFVYAGDREQAEAAEAEIRSVAAEHGWDVELELRHWHPTAEEWEDPDKPLPATDAERLAEHQELLAQEREDSDVRGYPEYEVRIECPSHHDTVKLDRRLHDEGGRTPARPAVGPRGRARPRRRRRAHRRGGPTCEPCRP